MSFQREIPRSFPRNILCALLLFAATAAHAETFASGHPRTTDNDDSCDIAQMPAATLLLPYFEVDLTSRNGENTIFTITNTAPEEQVAHVTLWTDWSYPVISFNIYLTGYDVQSISLYDVIALGQVAPARGTGYHDSGSPEGDYSLDNALVRRETCRSVPMDLGPTTRTRMQQAFTVGVQPGCSSIGSSQATAEHRRNGNALGFVTIDVVRSCHSYNAAEAEFYAELLYDNVLTGDYQQLNSGQNYAQSNPLVHIRAIPEGDTPTTRRDTNLPRTFYSAFQNAPNTIRDGRQPLPSTFAARWIEGGTGSFQTSFQDLARTGERPRPLVQCIQEKSRAEFRRGRSLRRGRERDCIRADARSCHAHRSRRWSADDRFDRQHRESFPSQSTGRNRRLDVFQSRSEGRAPVRESGVDRHLHARRRTLFGRSRRDRTRQRLHAAAGRVRGTSRSAVHRPRKKRQSMKRALLIVARLFPLGAQAGTFSSGHPRTTNNDDSCDIAQLPAATLLLPYFEVDLAERRDETAIVTITNTSPQEQLAHVTLWTTW